MSKKRFAAGILAALMLFTALAVVLAGSVSAKPKAAKATFLASLVSDVGRFNDKSFNQSQLAGLNKAKRVETNLDPAGKNARATLAVG